MRAILDDRARAATHARFRGCARARASAVGIVPALAVERIAEAARAERYDLAALGEAAVAAGNIAIPLINALTAEVAKTDAAAAGYVHWGATSQDVIDSALVLELRAAIDALIADLDRAIEGFTTLAARHRRTATVARTWMQHAVPMPFGLKLAGYAAALARSRERLRRLRREALVLQFGGAAGTLAALGDRGLEVAERLAALLDLPLPDAPWHSHRDRLAEVAVGIRDPHRHLRQDRARCFAADADRGGGGVRAGRARTRRIVDHAAQAQSDRRGDRARGRDDRSQSARDHLSPRRCRSTSARSAAGRRNGRRFPRWRSSPQARSTPSSTLRKGSKSTTSACASTSPRRGDCIMAEAVSFALASKLGKHEAHGIVEEASRKAAATKRDLQDVMAEDDRVKRQLTVGELAKLFEPMAYQGVAQTFIDRLIGSLQARGGKR